MKKFVFMEEMLMKKIVLKKVDLKQMKQSGKIIRYGSCSGNAFMCGSVG